MKPSERKIQPPSFVTRLLPMRLNPSLYRSSELFSGNVTIKAPGRFLFYLKSRKFVLQIMMLAELDGFYRVQQARYNELVVNAYMEIGRLAA